MIWQRDGKRRLRGPGSAAEHLWTRQRRRESTSSGVEEAQCAEKSPSEGQLSRGETALSRWGVRRPKVQRAQDPPTPTCESGWSLAPPSGRPRLSGVSASAPGSSTPSAGAPRLAPGNSLLAPLADRLRVSGSGLLSFLEHLLCYFSPFLPFNKSSCNWAPDGWGGTSGALAVSSPESYLPGEGRTQRRGRSGLSIWKFNCATAFLQNEPLLRFWKVFPRASSLRSLLALARRSLFDPQSSNHLERICCAT